MNIQLIPLKTSPSFGKILERQRNDYTPEQAALANDIRALLLKKRTDYVNSSKYVDLFEKQYGVDLELRPFRNGKDIELSVVNEYEDFYDFIKLFRSGEKPSKKTLESYISYTEMLNEERKDNIKAFLLSGLLILGSIFFIGKNTEPAKKIIEPKSKSSLVNDIKKISTDSLNIEKMLLK